MKTKNLKVYEGSGRNYTSIPLIRLQGKWLDSLGFSIGDQITVTCNENKIMIMKNADMQSGFGQEMEGNVCVE